MQMQDQIRVYNARERVRADLVKEDAFADLAETAPGNLEAIVDIILGAQQQAPELGSQPPHPNPSPVRVGIRTDDLLKMRGRARAYQVKQARVLGQDDVGLHVEIYYADCTVRAKRRQDGRPYHVVEVIAHG